MPSNGIAGGDEVEDLLLALVLLPAGEHLVRDVDVRELGERALEAFVAVAVGRRAGRAAHVDDVALAADLLEQPLGTEIGVLLLVIRDDVGRRLGDGLVDRHDDDPGLGRFLDARLMPSGSAGLTTMALTPAPIRLRMSSSCPAASVFRCAMLSDSTLPEASACAFIAQIISSRQPLPCTVLDTPIV